MKHFYPLSANAALVCSKFFVKGFRKFFVFGTFLFFSNGLFSQSNHTVAFSNSTSDFNALEKISAVAGGTDYYITFDQNNLYIGAFRTLGFSATDNLAVYIDTDPNGIPTSGSGTTAGKNYDGVTPTLPFRADYNVYATQALQEANIYSGSWVASVGPAYSTSANSREIAIPFAAMANPKALNLTMWIGNAGSIYSNAPGINIASSATPVIGNYFGTFGIMNGTQGNVNPVNVITSPATAYLSASGTVTGGTYANIDVSATMTINGLTLAPGGVINVIAGKDLVSTGTINNTAAINNTKSTRINVSGNYTLQGRVYCSAFNVNNGATYTHDVAGSVNNGAASDWPGLDYRTYGATSSVNIKQWAMNSGTAVVGIPAPTSGGWGNLAFNIKQSFASVWNQNGSLNNVAGNLVFNKIGTNDKSRYYLTFNPTIGDSTINIGGNFEMRMEDKNGIFLSLAGAASITETMNVHGDFISTGGHLKFGYQNAKVIVNFWGNYSQTGGEIKAYGTGGVTINAFGINKYLYADYGGWFSGTNFNTNDITFIVQNTASISLNSAFPLSGNNLGDASNCKFIVNGVFDCNNNILKGYGTVSFVLSDAGTLAITDGAGIAISGNSGSIQTPSRSFSQKGNYIYKGSGQNTGSGLPATVNSLTINNSSNSNTVSLTNDVTITSYHEIDKGKFNLGNKNVTLHSDANATASFNKLGTGADIIYGIGRYLVERYINSGIGAGQHGKAWMFLSTPASDVGLTVYNSWQESRNSITKYGTWITDPSGTANGFDDNSFAPSMKTYDAASDGWIGISSTNIPVTNPLGYFIYIRGDRSVTASVPNPTPTTLRIKGKLLTGNQPAITVPANSFQSIGNPYTSAVDFKKLYTHSSNIDNTFYAWDPSLSGTFGVGAYQTISGTTGYIAVPGASGIYTTNTDYSSIQSGEAIMVYNSAATSGSVNFTEDCKNTGSILVSRQAVAPSENQILFANLYTTSGVLADGNAVAFSNSFSNKIDKDDALKIANAGENFGIKRIDKSLAIEARSPVQKTDTVFYNVSHLRQQQYRLLFVPQNMNTSLSAFLIDRFLKTEKEVSLTNTTIINFSVTKDAASALPDRFMIVFRTSSALPVSFVSVNAIRQDKSVLIRWNVENEIGLREYAVEHATDGTHFSTIATISAMNISKAAYRFPDNNPAIGDNYYRIRSLDMDGKITYSPVVAIFNENVKSSISVYPNPLVNETMNLQFVGQPSGNYRVRLFNSAGQEVLLKIINHLADNKNETIQLTKNLPHGIYQLEITGTGGEKQLIKVSR